MKKRAFIEIHGLVEIILVLVVILALLSITGYYKVILNRFGEDTLCQGSFVASAMTKMFGQTTIDPKCRTNRITLVMEVEDEGITDTGGEKMALNKDYPSTIPSQAWDTNVRIDNWNRDYEDYKYTYQGGEEEITVQYNMDKIFADELKRCWTVTGKGNLPLFDNYWKFIGCDDGSGGVKECEDFGNFWKNLKNIPNYAARPVANFCVLCARIKFDDAVSGTYVGPYKSINQWMVNNPWQVGRKTNYLEYLTEEDQSFFGTPEFEFSTDKPQAVVFIRYNWHSLTEFAAGTVEFSDKAMSILPGYEETFEGEIIHYFNGLRIIPYEELPKECSYIVGSYI